MDRFIKYRKNSVVRILRVTMVHVSTRKHSRASLVVSNILKIIRWHLLVVLTMFFLCSQIFGQIEYEIEKQNADSLQRILPDLEGIERIDALNKLSLAWCLDNPDSSINIVSKTVALSERLDYKKGIADAYYNIGNYYFFLDSIKPMVRNYLEALSIYEEIDPCVEMGCVLSQLALVNRLTGRNEQAKKYFRRAIHIYYLLSEHRHEINATLTMGIIYNLSQEYDSAFYLYDRVFNLLDKHPDTLLLASVYHDYGRNCAHVHYYNNGSKEMLKEAISWRFKALELYEKLQSTEDISRTIFNIGTNYIALGTDENLKRGIEYARIAKSICDTSEIYVFVKPMLYRRLAIIEYQEGNSKNAIALLEKGLYEADKGMSGFSMKNYKDPKMGYHDKFTTKDYRESIFVDLYRIYKDLGDHQKALEYYILKEKAANEIISVENRNLVALLEADSENEKTQSRIDNLAKDNELKALKISQSRIFNYGLAGMFVILVLMGLLFIRQNKLKTEHKTVVLE